MRGKVETIREYTVERTKDPYFCDATTLVGMIRFAFRVYYNGLLVAILKNEGCRKKVVALLLRKRIIYAGHFSRIDGYAG